MGRLGKLGLAAVVALLAGCSAESLIAGLVDKGSLSATIDGHAYHDDVAYLAVSGGEVSIYAATTDKRTLEIKVDASALPGTVNLSDGGNRAYWRPHPEDSSQTYSTFEGSGTVTVTEYTGSLCAGTFSFRARTTGGAEVNVTGGSFRVSKLD